MRPAAPPAGSSAGPRAAATPAPDAGFTLVEMVLAVALLGVLVMMVTPVVRTNIQRNRELELQRDLRLMRAAIDAYHDKCKAGEFQAENDLNKICYPPDLDALVKGVEKGDANRTRVKFLRRIPLDPMTGAADWGLRSSQDAADSGSWGGENVWDVYSQSGALSLDGKTRYNEW